MWVWGQPWWERSPFFGVVCAKHAGDVGGVGIVDLSIGFFRGRGKKGAPEGVVPACGCGEERIEGAQIGHCGMREELGFKQTLGWAALCVSSSNAVPLKKI